MEFHVTGTTPLVRQRPCSYFVYEICPTQKLCIVCQFRLARINISFLYLRRADHTQSQAGKVDHVTLSVFYASNLWFLPQSPNNLGLSVTLLFNE